MSHCQHQTSHSANCWAELSFSFFSLQKQVDPYQGAENPVRRLLDEVSHLKEEVIERDIRLSSITDKLDQANMNLEKHKISNETQAQQHAVEISQ